MYRLATGIRSAVSVPDSVIDCGSDVLQALLVQILCLEYVIDSRQGHSLYDVARWGLSSEERQADLPAGRIFPKTIEKVVGLGLEGRVGASIESEFDGLFALVLSEGCNDNIGSERVSPGLPSLSG